MSEEFLMINLNIFTLDMSHEIVSMMNLQQCQKNPTIKNYLIPFPKVSKKALQNIPSSSLS
jgi:hypothetical protein